MNTNDKKSLVETYQTGDLQKLHQTIRIVTKNAISSIPVNEEYRQCFFRMADMIQFPVYLQGVKQNFSNTSMILCSIFAFASGSILFGFNIWLGVLMLIASVAVFIWSISISTHQQIVFNMSVEEIEHSIDELIQLFHRIGKLSQSSPLQVSQQSDSFSMESDGSFILRWLQDIYHRAERYGVSQAEDLRSFIDDLLEQCGYEAIADYTEKHNAWFEVELTKKTTKVLLPAIVNSETRKVIIKGKYAKSI